MDKWNEIRTAYHLAKLGTLSATAEQLGVHRSTVMRHIDTLEESLGVVLFQRNDKGYLPTEAGLEIMRLGEVTDNHFSQLSSRLKTQEQELEGTIRITLVSEMSSILMPTIQQYLLQHPKMNFELLGDIRNYKLEYGEADIAIRGGEKPTTPDNVVLPLLNAELTLCVHKDYVREHGMPELANLTEHKFVVLNERPEHLVWNEWIHQNVPKSNLSILSSNQHILTQALMSGCGLGVMPKQTVLDSDALIEIETDFDWNVSIWILIHRDMFHMPKIKKFLELLREQTEENKQWPKNLL